MALSGGPFVGSGRFVPVREWSCGRHESPRYHECDCGYCDVGEWECVECASAEWVDVFNEDGSRRMRELSAFEEMLWKSQVEFFRAPLLAQMLTELPSNGSKIVWVEDAHIPIVRPDPEAA